VSKTTRILAVDDEPIISESIASILEAPHRTVTVAANGRDALAKAAKQDFDVIITDHRMPESGGLELVRKLRQQKYGGKIIVLSGHLSEANIGTYEDLAIDEVISKPYQSAELREIVDYLEEDF
jgi:CheY-like chemotaxis protein